jgi:ribosomal protein L37AE/L43A
MVVEKDVRLKPCPICGAEVKLRSDGKCLWIIDCRSCGWSFVQGTNEKEGVELWNARAEVKNG